MSRRLGDPAERDGKLKVPHEIRVLAVVPGRHSWARGHWRREQMESLKSLGVHVRHLIAEERRNPHALMQFANRLRTLSRIHEVDVAHVHWGSSLGLTAALVSPVPVVISFCGSDLLGAYNPKGRRTLRGRSSSFLSQVGAIRAKATVAKSTGLRDALWPKSRKSCLVIPNGVDLEHFLPAPREQARRFLGWAGDETVVVFFDRAGAWVKNPGLAFSAFQSLRGRYPTARLEVIENEPYERMPHILNASDVLLMTSLHEGSSNLLKEALACNLPVVTTRCGDAAERLEGVYPSYICGYEPQELADSLGKVLDLNLRSNGRSAVIGLDVRRVAERILEVYHMVIRG